MLFVLFVLCLAAISLSGVISLTLGVYVLFTEYEPQNFKEEFKSLVLLFIASLVSTAALIFILPEKSEKLFINMLKDMFDFLVGLLT